MSGGYPAGGEYDSRAPYNQKNHGSCSTCGGTGEIQDAKICDDMTEFCSVTCRECKVSCNDCEGTGDKTEEQYLDEYESFKEDTKE